MAKLSNVLRRFDLLSCEQKSCVPSTKRNLEQIYERGVASSLRVRTHCPVNSESGFSGKAVQRARAV